MALNLGITPNSEIPGPIQRQLGQRSVAPGINTGKWGFSRIFGHLRGPKKRKGARSGQPLRRDRKCTYIALTGLGGYPSNG